jgi:hypothetical protein
MLSGGTAVPCSDDGFLPRITSAFNKIRAQFALSEPRAGSRASHFLGSVLMTATSVDVLNRHLSPLCPRDNHIMKYESHGPWHHAERRAACHCGFDGCSVRYDAIDGYHTVLRLDITPGCTAKRISRLNRVFAGGVASKAATTRSMPQLRALGSGLSNRLESCQRYKSFRCMACVTASNRLWV